MHILAGWPWATAAVFGELIAATDPVSVIATFKDAGARGRLLLPVESESLFNDGRGGIRRRASKLARAGGLKVNIHSVKRVG